MATAGSNRFSLRLILVLYVVLPLGLSLIVSGYLAMRTWERQVEDRMQSDLEMVARAIQLPLSHAMERKRQGGMEQALESALSIDSVYSAYAYDLDGASIASAGEKDPDPDREKLTDMAAEGKGTGEYGRVGERRVYSYFVPLIDSGNQSRGLLQLTRRERDFRNYIGTVRRHAALFLGLGMTAMIGLVLVGQYQALGRHFSRFNEGMQRVAGGDTEHRLPLSGPREIASISASFNHMLDSIQQAERQIRQNRREQQALEEQLRQTEKLAAVGQLAAGVAHELGTPLSTISGTAQRGLRSERPPEKIGNDFEKIRLEADRMEVIIRQLLDFSHRLRLKRRTLRPAQVASSAAAAVKDEAAGNNADITLAGDRGAAPFTADPVRMEQVLVNLLRNAVQSASPVTVRLGWDIGDRWAVFTVDDSGPGIPEKIQPRLFEPFFTTKNVGRGAGLGLAVVHGIVSEHGGDVEIDRSELGGARFKIILPINNQEEGPGHERSE